MQSNVSTFASGLQGRSTRAPLVVWDFDGVLNRSYDDAGFLWCRTLERDLGLSAAALQDLAFGGGRFRDVLAGRVSVIAHLAGVLAALGSPIAPQRLFDYWLARDFRPDPAVLSVVRGLARHGVASVIGTNSDPLRAAALRAAPELAAHFAAVYASGDIGAAKPDAAFFAAVAQATGAPPGDLLLVDDLATNLEAARAAGWRTLQFGDAKTRRAGDPRALRLKLSTILGAATAGL